MLHTVTVEPDQDGWRISSGGSEPLVFGTSAQALWSAGKVAESMAEAGAAAEIVVHDRSGRVAARFVCQTPTPALTRELELA